MALNIKNVETERLARELASCTGESITEAVTAALLERLARQKHPRRKRASEILAEAAERIAALPVRDVRSADEILGYDEHGLPA
jgi:antitoxin VapB